MTETAKIQFRDDFDVELIRSVGDDDAILEAMLVSTTGRQEAYEKIANMQQSAKAGRINFLMKNRHGSPFEHASMTFRVEAPIFVFREWHRHRIGVCIAGDSVIDFVDINNMRAPNICRTISDLWNNWENGEINGHASDSERLSEALRLVDAGISVRQASAKTGIARGTIDRNCRGLVVPGRRGARWRLGNMRVRVLDESTGLFTHSVVEDVIKSGVQEVVKIKVDSRSLRLTPSHPVLTPDGWVQIGNLKKGDRIARVGRVAKYERQVPPRLREGIGIWTESRRVDLIKDQDHCYRCGGLFKRKLLVLDHYIPVAEDLSLALTEENLMPCCVKCHRVKTNQEQKLATRGCRVGTVFTPLLRDPVKVGETMTYDLSVARHHNFVANGLIVHNSINEQSGRYSQLDPIFYIPGLKRPLKQIGKPGAYEYVAGESLVQAQMEETIKTACINAYRDYESLLNRGVAKEVARMLLPVNIYSSMVWTCNPRSLMNFLSLRVRSFDDGQEPRGMFPSTPMWEIERCALKMETSFAKLFPLTYAAFVEFGRVSP